jgi:type II secretory ATPase GspE/PulE/Tfp pilus assembly ATPase PilB-like protein
VNLLGEFLIERGLIRLDQVETALREQRRSRRFLGEILLTLGFIQRDVFFPALADHLGLPFVDLSLCSDYQYHPKGWVHLKGIEDDDSKTHVAVADPHDVFLQIDLAQAYPNREVVLSLTDPQMMARLNQENTQISQSQDYAPDLLRELVMQALEARASDLHFSPSSRHCQVLVRLDGSLVPLRTVHTEQWQALGAHIKVLAQLDLAESRRPQDGAFRFLKRQEPVDCRVSTLPTKDGESIVIRLLDPQSVQLGLDHLGLSAPQTHRLKQIAHLPHGLFVITGPTGSGKTTTLYSMLQEIRTTGRNIMTLEQPIEYRLEGIRQTEIQEGVMGYADGLRSILRHDPDVIYVAEIRDKETATTAVRAALTGHLVLTTLHAGEVSLIPRRLEDLGISLRYLPGVLKGGMSQRLIRLYCPDCQGAGCSSCLETGYRGRQVIAEVFSNGDDLETQYTVNAQERLDRYAQLLVRQGRTSLTEVHRILGTSGKEILRAA